MKTYYKGKLSISRSQGSGGTKISIELQGSNYQEVVRIECEPEDFGNAVTGLSFQECTFRLGNIDLIGKEKQRKACLLDRPHDYNLKDEEHLAIVKAKYPEHFEDGWRMDVSSYLNSHNFTNNDKVYAQFFRFVAVDQESVDK